MRSRLLWLVFAAWLSFAAAPMAVTAQQDPGQTIDPAEERSAQFIAVEGPQAEDVPGGPLLIGAYGVIWLLVVLYVLRLGRMQSRTSEEVARLERSLAAVDRKD